MRRKLLLTTIVTLATAVAARPAGAVNSGRIVGGTASGTIFQYPITQGSTETLTFTTSNLSPGSDTILHVQNADTPQFEYIGGNDDYPVGSPSSQVTVPAAGYLRHLLVLVRSYDAMSQGTCTLTTTSSTWGAWNVPNVWFGGQVHYVGDLQQSAHVTTVERQGGADDTVVLVLRWLPEEGIAFDDDDGTGWMSFIHLPEASTGSLVVANHDGSGTSTVDIIWDDDADTTDYDNDLLGATLESSICSSPTNCMKPDNNDTDADGLPDGAELLGVDIGVPVKLPTWGADPLQKDMFVEFDWKKCVDITNLSKCPQGIDSGKMGAGILSDADFQNLVVNKLKGEFEGNIRLHLDVGRANADAATWLEWGAWGGAGIQDTANSAGCGNEGSSPERAYYFHHGVSFPPEATDPPGLALGLSCYGPGPFFTTMVNAIRVVSHELGHGLGLLHGGRPFAGAINYKPNYISTMNYAYEYSMPAPRTFSHGTASPVANLNPTSLNEVSGLGQTWSDSSLKSYVLTKLRDAWCPVTSYNSGNCVNLTTGAVDWNRNGVFETSAQGAVASFDFSKARRSVWSGTHKLKDPAMTWVSASSGTQLFIVGRNQSNQFVWAKTAAAAINGGCSGPFSAFNESDPDCAGFGNPALASLFPAPNTSAVAPGVAEYGSGANKQALVVFQRDTGFVTSKLVTFNSVGSPEFGVDVVLPGSVTATGDITAVAVSATEVRAYAPRSLGSSARLREWKYVSGSWSDLGDQQWSDATNIVPTFGIGATRGYQDSSSTASTYGAIPIWPDNLVEFARKSNALPYRWSKVTFTCPSGTFGCPAGTASSWAGTGDAGLPPAGTQPRAAARPGLAYQKRAGQPNNFVGRFYMAINQAAQCSGPYGTPSGTPAGCSSRLIMTEGNIASGAMPPTTKRLTWITPAHWLETRFAVGAISLLDDLTRDTNLRAAFADVNGTGFFEPLADGIVNATLGDMNDFPYVTGGLSASICRSGGTWPSGCVSPLP